ncbi:hypothetical protein GUJ93_ZPchr0001g29301 [Zizania palustris]|uniref:Aminotransferase class I/classII large domain-containing protein n=1 Tax=Zizania palustris TaxID=103762 RepID=A0A8J5VU03_ZIZPA|nr:hypothetical protein GUJ93_ZPchr0001g29301 [Zizania palustris]
MANHSDALGQVDVFQIRKRTAAHRDKAPIGQAAQHAAQEYGMGLRGSALICGYTTYHKLEESLAELKKKKDCLLCPTGFFANMAVMTAWEASGSISLQALWFSCSIERKVVVTDSLFSMDGDFAPLPELVKLHRKYGNGSGAPELFGCENDIDISVGTLSKAVVCQGNFIPCSNRWKRLIQSRGRSFIFSTALPVLIVCLCPCCSLFGSEEAALRGWQAYVKIWISRYTNSTTATKLMQLVSAAPPPLVRCSAASPPLVRRSASAAPPHPAPRNLTLTLRPPPVRRSASAGPPLRLCGSVLLSTSVALVRGVQAALIGLRLCSSASAHRLIGTRVRKFGSVIVQMPDQEPSTGKKETDWGSNIRYWYWF